MSKFNFRVTDDTIIIESDTYWSCRCDGNILLSKYSGIGDDVIDLLKHEDIKYHVGHVYFTYGDERCEYPYELIQYKNNCIILDTTPMWTLCDDDSTKVIFFKYKDESDTIRIKVHPPNIEYIYDKNGNLIEVDKGWKVVDDGGHVYFCNDNEILIVANTDNDFVIGASKCEDDSKYIYIKLTKLN